MSYTEPTCPQCGCGARVVHIYRSKVRCILEPDGSVGKLLSASREPRDKVAYECNGGHVWGASCTPS